MSALERWYQLVDAPLYLMKEKWSVNNGKAIQAIRVYGSAKHRALGSIAAGRVAEVDWASSGQAVVVYLESSEASWRDTAAATASIIDCAESD